MSAFNEEKVLEVHHWTDRLFTFKTTRDASMRFSNGHFTMIGLRVNEKPLLRAYSIVSANYEDHLEFLSIKVPYGPLTSRLQHVKVGDTIIVGRKPTGTLLVDYLLPGKRLFLLSTGTGLAPFMSIVRDPETYEKFEQIVLVHGVRVHGGADGAEHRHEVRREEPAPRPAGRGLLGRRQDGGRPRGRREPDVTGHRVAVRRPADNLVRHLHRQAPPDPSHFDGGD